MSTKFYSAIRLAIVVAALLLAGVTAHAAADKELKLEAQLVIGSNDPHQTNGVPVTVQIAKKLARLPLKWQYYFVVSSQKFSVTRDHAKEVSLSADCQIFVQTFGNEEVQMTLMSNGQNVGKIKQTLPKGHTIVAGGNAGNSIVVLQQVY
jgi:hypothetical protein